MSFIRLLTFFSLIEPQIKVFIAYFPRDAIMVLGALDCLTSYNPEIGQSVVNNCYILQRSESTGKNIYYCQVVYIYTEKSVQWLQFSYKIIKNKTA